MNPKINVFLDSGAHSLYETVMKEHTSARKGVVDYSYIETEKFWTYVDSYAEYIKEHKDLIDTYVNVDVIFNAEGSLRVQKYLEEEHKLSPMPVFHPKEDFKYLKHYMDNYEYIGIGGLGQDMTRKEYFKFGDSVFEMLKGSNIKTHGFAMTSLILMGRYPWSTVDSTSWVMFSRYGIVLVPRKRILVPKKRKGEYVFNENPWIVTVSERSPRRSDTDRHYQTCTDIEQNYFRTYIEHMGFSLGKSTMVDGVEQKEESGVCNDHLARDLLNLLFYLKAGNEMGLNLFFAGNFPQMVNYDREKEVSEKVIQQEGEYRRLISYFFEENSENILYLKKGEKPDAPIKKKNTGTRKTRAARNEVRPGTPENGNEQSGPRISRPRGNRANDSFHFHRRQEH